MLEEEEGASGVRWDEADTCGPAGLAAAAAVVGGVTCFLRIPHSGTRHATTS